MLYYCKGAMICMKIACACGNVFSWYSHPVFGKRPEGNVEIASSLYLSGILFKQYKSFCGSLDIAMFSRTTCDKIINSIISPVINSVMDSTILQGFAQNFVYSLMDLHRGIIVDFELLQIGIVKGDLEKNACENLISKLTAKENSDLNIGSEAYYALKKIVLDKSFLKDLKHVKHYAHTGNLDSYHNVHLKYAPKRVHFSFSSLHRRSILAVTYRSQYSMSSGDWVLNNKYALSSDGWKEDIMKRILANLRDQDLPEEEPGE
ncbi:hypothetical protein PR048_017039, partial [Dryococelus australis]